MAQTEQLDDVGFSNFRNYVRASIIVESSLCMGVDAHAKTDPRPARRAMIEFDTTDLEMSRCFASLTR